MLDVKINRQAPFRYLNVIALLGTVAVSAAGISLLDSFWFILFLFFEGNVSQCCLRILMFLRDPKVLQN